MKTIPRYGSFVVLVVALITLVSTSARARKEHLQTAPDDAPPSASFATQPIHAFEQVLGEWDFESPPGQGWTPADHTTQPGNFTHVDDFALMGGPPYIPLSGAKSLWCGRRAGADCTYLSLPGYGNFWDQSFTSVALPTGFGDVHVTYTVRYDTEPLYDLVNVEYQALSGNWILASQYSGTGQTSSSITVPDADIGSTVRVRFRFVSDGAYSDQDGGYPSSGAYELDNVVVSDGLGTINTQNFEAEAVNAQTTVDGKWSATVAPAYGLHAALFAGSTVLQEDPSTTNTTQLWGFFNNSPYDYSCAGHPEQLVVPYSRTVEGVPLYLDNVIESPPIGITTDAGGYPVSGPISLTFDVYRDLQLGALVFYQFKVRSYVAGCWKSWKRNSTIYYGVDKTWARPTYSLASLIEPGATQIQVAVGAIDMCPIWCGIYGTGACHSHGPLFDNVKVFAVPATAAYVVTNTNDSGAGCLRTAINQANSSSDYSAISFNIPGAGPHIITPASALPNITQRVVIDGYTQPGASVNTNGTWHADNAVIKIVLNGSPGVSNGLVILSANYCTIRGLAVRSFSSNNGIFMQGTGNVVEGCFIGTDASGTVAGGNEYGIQVAGSNAVIGGNTPASCNVIAASNNTGIWLAATGCTVKNNFIGTDATGTVDLGNNWGMLVNSGTATVALNLISGNNHGIAVAGFDPSGTQLLGNRIGTDISGTLALGNSLEGVDMNPNGASLGGTITIGTAIAPNRIAFNGGNGINVRVFDGTDPPRMIITRNEIYSNNKGVAIAGASTFADPGIATLEGNSIHDNTLLGIDLGPVGVTANDAGDVDLGPNGLQNFPTVTSVANLVGGGVTISGNLASTANRAFAVEYFASPACDGSGYGEGTVFVGRTTGVSNGSGNLNFTLDAPAGIPGGWYVTTTATDLVNNGTSEFSTCLGYTNTPTGSAVFVVPVDPTTLQSPVRLTFSSVSGAGNTSVATGNTGPPPPGTWSFGDDPTYYNITTTASFSGSIQVCIHYDETNFSVPESQLKVLHYNGTSWADVTTSLDTNANILCGTSMSLSPFVIAQASGATDVGDHAPSRYVLYQCVPNPFNPSTTIRYDVPENGARVSIAVFDVSGRRVRSLVDSVRPAGQQSVTWDGRDDHGSTVASGVYFYRMIAGSFAQTRKMVLLK